MNSIGMDERLGKASPTGNRWYTLILLAMVYTMSSLDRFLLGIVLPYIKAEMTLSDTLLGLLSGAAFAIFYATLGLPIARLADRYSRKLIITVSLAIFSVMTVLCGFASSFAMLFIARIGVGIGEAGTSPASYSIISDRFEPERRSTAMRSYRWAAMSAYCLVLSRADILLQTMAGAPHFWWQACRDFCWRF